MGALDFSEIPAANAGPRRDDWELFAREFLKWKGFQIISGPDRGADGGRDLIVEEVRLGPGGETRLRWLVSCKHFAPSGKSVGPNHEINIGERLKVHNCNGFMGFYSTICTSGLSDILSAQDHVVIYDSASIERELLPSAGGFMLALRFMPNSAAMWRQRAGVPYGVPRSSEFGEVISDQYFMRSPHLTLHSALAEASDRGLLTLVLLYGDEPSERQRFADSVSRFLEYSGVRDLVRENFVPVVISTQDDGAAGLISGLDSIQAGWWVALGPDGSPIRSEALTASPDDGLRCIKEVIRVSRIGSWNATRMPGYPRYVFRSLREKQIGACMAVLQGGASERAAWVLVDHDGIVLAFDGWYLPQQERLDPSESERYEWIRMALKYPSFENWDGKEANDASILKTWQIP
ncbi:hypothetical protein [Actinoplanes sp. NPDC026670]|uniref:hypothetical protein n=1 Tax=Actinoplanes sp. NPDC026670 TaxID=3154700 RepID=UPI0033DE6177